MVFIILAEEKNLAERSSGPGLPGGQDLSVLCLIRYCSAFDGIHGSMVTPHVHEDNALIRPERVTFSEEIITIPSES